MEKGLERIAGFAKGLNIQFFKIDLFFNEVILNN